MTWWWNGCILTEPEPTAAGNWPPPRTQSLWARVLDEHPVAIPVNGQWRTFPNAKGRPSRRPTRSTKANLRRNAQNFRISDEHLGEGGPKAKFQANVSMRFSLLKAAGGAAGRRPAPEQQEVLSRYVGWGGLADAFDPDKPAWAAEYSGTERAADPGGIRCGQSLHPQCPLHQPYRHPCHL